MDFFYQNVKNFLTHLFLIAEDKNSIDDSFQICYSPYRSFSLDY